MNGRDLRHGSDDGYGRLPTTSAHVDVGRLEMGVAVHNRNDVRTDSCRGQVDHHLSGRPAQLGVMLVRIRARRIENDLDLVPYGHFGQGVHALMCRLHTHFGRIHQTVAARIDADECAHFQDVGMPHDFNHQIGADVSGADDSDFHLRTIGKRGHKLLRR